MDQELERIDIVKGYTHDNVKVHVSLRSLMSSIESGKRLSKLTEPVELVKFEMLEAELLNQRILPKTNETLSQKIRHEVNLLSWHAKRLGVDTNLIKFLIDVPKLIIELSNSDTTKNNSASMEYLELFADFILGKFDSASNTYEEGLNVVLKAILKSKDDNLLDHKVCILPTTKAEFFKLLNLKDQLAK